MRVLKGLVYKDKSRTLLSSCSDGKTCEASEVTVELSDTEECVI